MCYLELIFNSLETIYSAINIDRMSYFSFTFPLVFISHYKLINFFIQRNVKNITVNNSNFLSMTFSLIFQQLCAWYFQEVFNEHFRKH